MKKWIFLLFIGVITLGGAEINYKSGSMQLTFDTKGGGITSFLWNKKQLNHGGTSFNERIMGNQAEQKQKIQVLESFADLEYRPRFLKNTGAGLDLEFSVRGIGAFDWLRLTKTFHWKRDNRFFTVDYKLENLDTVPRHAALWGQTFLRSEGKNRYMLGNQTVEANGEKWMLNPTYPATAVWSKKDEFGAIITVPKPLLDTFYIWSSEKTTLATLEYITRDLPVEPGKPLKFSVQVQFGFDIPKKLGKLFKEHPVSQEQKLGDALYRPQFLSTGKERDLKILQCRGGMIVKPSRKAMILNIPRQYSDSVREITLPDNTDLSQLSLCEVANGVADDTRDVPFAVSEKNGKKVMRFPVPGINASFLYHGKIRKDRIFRDSKGTYIAPADYPVELRFDRAPQSKTNVEIGEPNLFADSGFSQLSKDGRPKKWLTPSAVWGRKWYRMVDGALAVTRPAAKDRWVMFYEYFNLEPNMKYHISARVRNINPIHGASSGSIVFLDENGQELHQIDSSGKKTRAGITRFYPGYKNTHDWQNFEATFYAPPKAVIGKVHLVVYGIKDQTVLIDDLKLVPEPYSTVTANLQSKLRDALKISWYKPLDLIERNSHAVETPHEKWLKPAGFELPEILFLPFNIGSYSDMERRIIVELSQRMNLRYKLIPLLGRIAEIPHTGVMGVYHSTLLPELEPYTIECLKNAPESKVLFVSGVNFKKNVKALFIQWLKERGQKSSIFFHECEEIPAELLGEELALPPELKLQPQIRFVPEKEFAKLVRIYRKNGHLNAAVNLTAPQYRKNNPVVPAFELKSDTPVYISRDFPFWEFEYLTVAKTLRHIACTAPAALITDVKNNTALIQASKPLTAKLESRFDTLFRYTVAKTEQKIELKQGLNRVSLAVPAGFSGDLVAYLKLSAGGKVLDGAGTKIKGAEKVKIALKFPGGVCVPFGKAMPVAVKVTGAAPDAEINAIVEDSDFRQVARVSGKGAELKLNFTPKFPFTTLYRVLVSVKEQGKEAAAATHEICFAGRGDDPKEIRAYMWGGRYPQKYFIYKKLGFDQFQIWYSNNTGRTRLLRNLNLEPVTFGTGNTSYRNWDPYKFDKSEEVRGVRNPCFSDPAVQKFAQTRINDFMRNKSFYDYDVKFHLLGDERYIGNAICFSPHCLKALRSVLKTQYGSVEKLNKAWGTAYKSFDEATPLPLQELKDKSKLGPFVDHKLFISRLFAEGYMGKMRERLKAKVPSSLIGLSGTGNPGYSYDWSLVIKQLDFLTCYDGVQRTLARDFANPGTAIGQWFGGYVPPVPVEGYMNSFFWRDLLQGARLSPNWTPRAGVTGDLLLTPQLEFHGKLLKESRNGIAKLILNGSVQPEVAMVYSQSSLYTMAGTIGIGNYNDTLSGWHALLGDLGIDYKFLNEPELAKTLDNRFKVLILPGTLAISDAGWKAIRRYAEKGGTVIADLTPGIYDEHGTLRAGFKVPQFANRKFNGVEFRTTDVQTAVMQEQKIGKGRIFTMNLALLGYQKVVLGGIGGETSQNLSGSEKFCSVLRKVVSQELAKAGVKRDRIVTGKDGRMRQAETVWREFNGNAIFGIWKFDRTVPVLNPASGEKVTVKIPRKGHLYDVRNGKYIGFTDTFQYQLYPGGADVFAVLSEKPQAVQLECGKSVKCGEEVNFSMQCGKGGHVFHCELIDPAGKVRYQRNLSGPDGTAKGSFQVAFSDPAGVWTLRVKDVASSLVKERKIQGYLY